MTPTLEISKAGPEFEVLLRNLYEHYIHDMSEWLGIDTGPDGSYSYDTAELWKKGFEVYLAKAGGSIAGFAVVGSADEWLGEAGVRDVHEFFVLRKFRGTGAGRQLAEHIWNDHPGRWLVRVFEGNGPAIPFWRSAIAAYTSGQFVEELCVANGRNWLFFRFGSVVRSAE